VDVAVLLFANAIPPAGLEDRVAAEIAKRTLLDIDVTKLTDEAPVLGIEVVGRGRRVSARDPDRADDTEERIRPRYLDTVHLGRVQNHYLYLYGDPP
jgi:hypothetical protein